jgi:hypothetical protein
VSQTGSRRNAALGNRREQQSSNKILPRDSTETPTATNLREQTGIPRKIRRARDSIFALGRTWSTSDHQQPESPNYLEWMMILLVGVVGFEPTVVWQRLGFSMR